MNSATDSPVASAGLGSNAEAVSANEHRGVKVGFMAVLALASATGGLAIGAVPIDLLALLSGEGSALTTTVFLEIRSPRVALAGFVGAACGLAGASLQGLFRNPLADPGLIGVSAGAALGAVAMIVIGDRLELPASFVPYSLPLAAVAGALAVTLFLYAFASWAGRFSMVTLLLVGIAVNALSTVGIGAFEYLADDRQLRALVFWMMGSFGRARWDAVLPALFLMGVAGALLITQARALDVLQLGEAEAGYLGIDVSRMKRIVILGSAVAVGAGVALAGIIGFVGLVVPHLVRLLIGPGHPFLLPGSACLGAALMIAADVVARTLIVPAELPVSLVTSALGAPLFLWLVARVRPT